MSRDENGHDSSLRTVPIHSLNFLVLHERRSEDPGKKWSHKKLNSHTNTSKGFLSSREEYIRIYLHMTIKSHKKEPKKKELPHVAEPKFLLPKSLHVFMLDLLHINWVEEKFKIQSAFAQHHDVRDIKFNVFQGYQHAFDAAALFNVHCLVLTQPSSDLRRIVCELWNETKNERRIMKNTMK